MRQASHHCRVGTSKELIFFQYNMGYLSMFAVVLSQSNCKKKFNLIWNLSFSHYNNYKTISGNIFCYCCLRTPGSVIPPGYLSTCPWTRHQSFVVSPTRTVQQQFLGTDSRELIVEISFIMLDATFKGLNPCC